MKEIPFGFRRRSIIKTNLEAKLRGFLNKEEPKIARWLVKNWDDEANAITYREIREALATGEVSADWINRWQQDYSRFVTDVMTPEWEKAFIDAGSVVAKDLSDYAGRSFRYTATGRRVEEFIQERGGMLAKNLTDTQHDALKELIHHFVVDEPVSAQKFATYIRPVVGLTGKDTKAMLKFRDRLIAEGLSPDKVDIQVKKYAEFLHKTRSIKIARTEISYSYNYGEFDAVGKARDEGYINGETVKVWITADDERTCPLCGAMDGEIIGYDEQFDGIDGPIDCPPLHPNCRCTLGYEVLERE
jgi:SPP1 gp7 family putative phage head morphogenesis protein